MSIATIIIMEKNSNRVIGYLLNIDLFENYRGDKVYPLYVFLTEIFL